MCLIRVRPEVEEEVHIPARQVQQVNQPDMTTTTVITPIPPAPVPAPDQYSAQMQTNSQMAALSQQNQSNYAYDMGSQSLIEGNYEANRYDDRRNSRDYRDASEYGDRRSRHDYREESEYGYSENKRSRSHRSRSRRSRSIGYDDSSNGSVEDCVPVTTKKTTIIRGGSFSDAISRSGSYMERTRSINGDTIVDGALVNVDIDSKDEVIIGPDGMPYRRTKHKRHRHRSGSIEREKVTSTFRQEPDLGARESRRSVISVSGGRSQREYISEAGSYYGGGDGRSSFRYIDNRGSVNGLDLGDKQRENERLAYGSSYGGVRRAGSVSYAGGGARSSVGSIHARSVSGGIGRRSGERVMVVGSDYGGSSYR